MRSNRLDNTGVEAGFAQGSFLCCRKTPRIGNTMAVEISRWTVVYIVHNCRLWLGYLNLLDHCHMSKEVPVTL